MAQEVKEFGKDYCTARKSTIKEPCRMRFDCQKYTNFFTIIDEDYFNGDKKKMWGGEAPFATVNKVFKCTCFSERDEVKNKDNEQV